MQLAFIVGTGCCGSTLLHEIFAKHADTSFLSQIEEKLAAPWRGCIGLPTGSTARTQTIGSMAGSG
ncbi:MAG: hypothetical protein R3E84_04105 [Pseudomonadales bacterium]